MKLHHELSSAERWDAYVASLGETCILSGLDELPCCGTVTTAPNPLDFDLTPTPLCTAHWKYTHALYREQMDVYESGLL